MLWLSYFLMALLLFVGTLLIFIILLQRGRGGGLAGALGGMGGQSAFGTKAGDFFTRVTVVLAVIWIVLCAGQIRILRAVGTRFVPGEATAPALEAPRLDKNGKPLPPDKTGADQANPDGEDTLEIPDMPSEKPDAKPAAKKSDAPKAGKKPDGDSPASNDEKSDSEPAKEKAETKSEAAPEAESKSEDQPKSDEKSKAESK